MAYQDYNSDDGELNHVHVERKNSDGDWVHHTRIAEHGFDKVVDDGGYRFYGPSPKWVDTIRFVFDWGSGPVVVMERGVVVEDGR